MGPTIVKKDPREDFETLLTYHSSKPMTMGTHHHHHPPLYILLACQTDSKRMRVCWDKIILITIDGPPSLLLLRQTSYQLQSTRRPPPLYLPMVLVPNDRLPEFKCFTNFG
jgi:hypothetical protein